jgi:hypothetical protein
MKYQILTLLFVLSLTCGCTPSNQPPPAVEATPAAPTGEEIKEMDFESGEVDQPVTETEEPAADPTPDVP